MSEANFSPREIVSELDRNIVGQHDAKRAVAVALRNRWRRQQLDSDMRREITPKNILMIGPTGVGKTEIARRLARLAQAPFIKVEATKFTEVGYVGRDVEQIIRDLVEAGIAVLRHYRRELPLWFVGWLAGWVLACLYFAGEEASWGQHYFRWATPEALRGLNDQNETNLHNIGTWLDQKPRTLVELWMIFAGFIVPIVHRFKPRALYADRSWARWFWPTGFAIPTVLAFLFAFVVSLVAKKTSSATLMWLGSNELREFYVAFFLSGYLTSLWLRLRAEARGGNR